MPWAPKIRPPVVQCGDCGKPRRIGSRHTCVTRLDRRPRSGHTTVKAARAEIWTCPDCSKPGNPFTHRCVKRTDFAKRKAAAEKQERAEERKRAAEARKKKPRKRRNEHPEPDECDDDDCQRYGCVWFKRGYDKGYAAGHASGFAEGHAEGYGKGEADGHAEGYSEGFSAGAASNDG